MNTLEWWLRVVLIFSSLTAVVAHGQGSLISDSAHLAWVVGKALNSKPKPEIPPGEIQVVCRCGRGSRVWVEDSGGREVAEQIYVGQDLRFLVGSTGIYTIRAEDAVTRRALVRAGARGGEAVRLGNPPGLP